jgi:hypothetical protein
MRRARLSIAILAASVLLLTASVGVASASSPRLLAQVVQLSGANEVCTPPTPCGDADGRGRAVLLIVPAFNLVCWHISWRDVDGVVAAHIHGQAAAGANAGVVVDFTASVKPGASSASGCTKDADADPIAETPSLYYVNVHSAANPGGAIRGQLH